MTENQKKVMVYAEQNQHIKTTDIVALLQISRQSAHSVLTKLVTDGKLVKIGTTSTSSYAIPTYAANHLEIYPARFHKEYRTADLEEDTVFSEIENRWPFITQVSKNVLQILRYGFLEMLNNAIDHSQSVFVEIELSIKENQLNFIINDSGVGVFRNIRNQKGLQTELEAIQDVLKGKLTTAPDAHSGQGIFFTSKMADVFYLESFDYQLITDNLIDDIFLTPPKKTKKGTRVSFTIDLNSQRDINDIFKKYTNIGENSDYGFDRTDVKVKLYTQEGSYVSRSQARRILVGLDKFESIILDFKMIDGVGQAFADEIFRVFHKKHPNIEIITTNMNELVEFMVKRVDRI